MEMWTSSVAESSDRSRPDSIIPNSLFMAFFALFFALKSYLLSQKSAFKKKLWILFCRKYN
jgi:hypothetical protein